MRSSSGAPPASLHRMMADRFDAVAVGVTEEGGVVGSVVAAQARRAVVTAAGRDAGVPERIDLALPARLEAPMAAGGVLRLRPLADRDVDAVRIGRPRALAIAEPILAAADLDHAQRFHDGIVEALGRGDVGGGDGNVGGHRFSVAGVRTPSSAAPALPAALSFAPLRLRAFLSLLRRSLPARWRRIFRWRAWRRRA